MPWSIAEPAAEVLVLDKTLCLVLQPVYRLVLPQSQLLHS